MDICPPWCGDFSTKERKRKDKKERKGKEKKKKERKKEPKKERIKEKDKSKRNKEYHNRSLRELIKEKERHISLHSIYLTTFDISHYVILVNVAVYFGDRYVLSCCILRHGVGISDMFVIILQCVGYTVSFNTFVVL
jgi:hypothetical protein